MSNLHTHTTTRSEAPHVAGPHFPLPPSSADEQTDLRTLQSRIEQIASTVEDKPAAIRAFLGLAKSLTNAKDLAYAFRSGGERGELDTLYSLEAGELFQTEASRGLLARWSASACANGSVELNRMDGRSETIVTLPVFNQGKAIDALSAALLVPRGQIEPFVVSLQLVATAIGAWSGRSSSKSEQTEAAISASVSAAVIELIGKCQTADSTNEVAFTVVNEMQKLVQCESVALAVCQRGNPRATIVAVSGHGAIDQKSEVIRHLTEAANEAIDRESQTVWPPLSMDDHHTTRLHQQLVKNSPYSAVASHPLETEQEILGAWLFLGNPESIHHQRTLRCASAASPHLASTLALRKQADAGPWSRVKRVVRGTEKSRRVRAKVFIGALLAAVLLCIPIPYKISCECSVEPTVRRFATVPFNGILQTSLVRPGDFVQPNQVIARMDTRDLRLEQSEATKSMSANRKEFDRQRADEHIAEAQIARLRSAEARSRLDLILHRIEHSEIRSPIAGVVLDGDLEDVQGASVQRGQTLFEVGPLDSLELKLLIPEADISLADVSLPVTARLDGAPGQRIEAELGHINPRASAESGSNSFAAEAALPSEKLLDGEYEGLRPGMRGTAKIVGPKKMIGWILFHRAYRKVVDFIDW